jgi:hypothetical protein
MRLLKTTFLATGLGFALVVGISACGDDDSAGPGGKLDSGTESSTNPPIDGSITDPDGNPPGCEFNAFVTGLINNSTNATALPSTDLGENCVDNQTPFPATLFQ